MEQKKITLLDLVNKEWEEHISFRFCAEQKPCGNAPPYLYTVNTTYFKINSLTSATLIFNPNTLEVCGGELKCPIDYPQIYLLTPHKLIFKDYTNFRVTLCISKSYVKYGFSAMISIEFRESKYGDDSYRNIATLPLAHQIN